ncbi:MAG: TonB-dependent receptor [Opitutaceae bacterium]
MKRQDQHNQFAPYVALVASLSAAPLFADVAPVAEGSELMVNELEPYVVVVNRTPISLDEASPSVAYISADDMEANQDRSLVDALKRQPGVVINTSGTNGSISSLFLRGTNSDHTGFFIDGRRLNPGFGNQYNLEFLTLENLESAQIMKGASSVNYGSSGIGGIVDLQTRSELGSDVTESSIEAEVGSNEYRRAAFSAAFAEERWAFSAGGTVLETDNERVNDEFENRSLNARFDYQLTSLLTFELLGLFSDVEKGLPGTDDDPQAADFGETESWLLSPGVRYENGDWSGQFFYSRSELTMDTTTFEYGFSAPFSSGLLDATNYIESDELYLQIDYTAVDQLLASAGLVYRNDQAYNSNLDSYDFTAPERPYAGRFEQFGIWSQIQVDLTDAFQIRLSGRYDRYTDFDSGYNGSVEAIYTVESTGSVVFAKLANSYAPPSAADIAFDFDPAGTPLQPEESIAYEFGVKQNLLDDTFQVAVVAFRNEIEDLIGYNGLDAFNVNHATTEGIELSAEYTAIEKLTLGLGYTYLTAMDDENDVRLLRRPRHLLQLSAFYQPIDSLSVGLTGTGYFGREDASFGPPPTFTMIQADQEDYFVVELHLSWDVSDRLNIFARAENLLDESYESVLGYPALGRTGYIGARWSF